MKFFKPKLPPYRSVLFVCTANITRSTTAEALFRAHIANSYLEWDVDSAGVKALTSWFRLRGQSLHPMVKLHLQNSKIFPNYMHFSQQVTKKLLKQYYWILVMENAHKECINKLGINLDSRMFTVREFGLSTPPPEIDMPDPTGSELKEDYNENYRELFTILEREIPRIANFLTDEIMKLEDRDNQEQDI